MSVWIVWNKLKNNVALTSQSWVSVVLEPCKFTSRSRRATWRFDRVACIQSDDVFLIVRYRRWIRRLGVELRCTMKRCRHPNSLVLQTADFNGLFHASWIFECSVLSSRGVNVLCEYTMPLWNWQSSSADWVTKEYIYTFIPRKPWAIKTQRKEKRTKWMKHNRKARRAGQKSHDRQPR
jgi:hypothetical protein